MPSHGISLRTIKSHIKRHSNDKPRFSAGAVKLMKKMTDDAVAEFAKKAQKISISACKTLSKKEIVYAIKLIYEKSIKKAELRKTFQKLFYRMTKRDILKTHTIPMTQIASASKPLRMTKDAKLFLSYFCTTMLDLLIVYLDNYVDRKTMKTPSHVRKIIQDTEALKMYWVRK